MDTEPPAKKQKILLVLGIACIAAGIFLNTWTIGTFLRPIPRPITSLPNKLIIWAFQTILVLCGTFIIARRKTLTAQTILRGYRRGAFILFNLLLAFVGLNILIYGMHMIIASFAGAPNPVEKKYGVSLAELYPGLDAQAIGGIEKERGARAFAFESYGQFKDGAFHGTYINVEDAGFRDVKDQRAWPPDKKNTNIFLFGGSTTFNYGVPDDQTIASVLQETLNASNSKKHIAIYNFGRGYYYSSQERVLYEKLLVAGYVPDIAVFIDGINDYDFKFINDEPMYSDEFASFAFGQSVPDFRNLPLVQLVTGLAQRFSQTQDTEYWKRPDAKPLVAKVADRYMTNKKIIEGTSQKFSVQTVFVWQPAPTYKYDLHYHLFSTGIENLGTTVGYPYMADYVKRHDLGPDFLYLADIQKNVQKPLYVDAVHYSSELSGMVAERIASFLEVNALIQKTQ